MYWSVLWRIPKQAKVCRECSCWEGGGVGMLLLLALSSNTPRPLSCPLFPRPPVSFVSSGMYIAFIYHLEEMFSGHLCYNSSWVEALRFLLKVAHGAESWLWSDHCRVVLRNVLAAVLLLAFWDCTCLFGSLIVLLTQITVNNPEVFYCATTSALYTCPEASVSLAALINVLNMMWSEGVRFCVSYTRKYLGFVMAHYLSQSFLPLLSGCVLE